MSSSFNFAGTLRIARNTAMYLEGRNSSDFHKYSDLYQKARASFYDAYWDKNKETIGDGSQSALVYCLYINCTASKKEDDAMFEQLLKLIATGTKKCDSAPCLDTGILATKWIMELLSLRGRTDIGLDLALKTDFPSWGYMARMNATTIWEHWEYMNGDGMNSHAHPAFASVGAWFYRWIAGIRLDDGSLDEPNNEYGMGWKRILFSPGCVVDSRLSSAHARITSPFGPVITSWANRSGKLQMNITVPVDVKARVQFPAHIKGVSRVEKDFTIAEQENGKNIVLSVGSGTWNFVGK
eukprot:UC4_evm1s1169